MLGHGSWGSRLRFETLPRAAAIFFDGWSWPGLLSLLYALYLETLKPVRTSPSIGFFIYLPGGSGFLSPRPGLMGDSTPFAKKEGEGEYIHHFHG